MWAALILAMVCFASISALALELPEYYRGVRYMGMGGVGATFADDEDALFYNPAGLSFQRDLRLYLLNPKFDLTSDVCSNPTNCSQMMQGFSIQKIQKFFDKNVYASASVFPAVYFPGFAIGYIYQAQLYMNAQNLSLPRIDLRYILDRGVNTGFGFETRGIKKKHYVRWGVGARWLLRSGFDGQIPLTDLATANKSYLKSLRSAEAVGVGVTVGIQYEFVFDRQNSIILGSAWQDIGDTKFGGRYSGGNPPMQENNLAAGAAFVHKFSVYPRSKSNVKLVGEGRHLMQKDKDPRLKEHFGAEFQTGFFSLQAGLNETAWTAGLGLEFWNLKLNVASYAENTKSIARMDEDRRYMLQFTFFLDMLSKEGKTLKEDDRYKYPRKFD